MKLLAHSLNPSPKLYISVQFEPETLPNYMFYVELFLYNETDLAFDFSLNSPCKKVAQSQAINANTQQSLGRLRYRELDQLEKLNVLISNVLGENLADEAEYTISLNLGIKLFERYEKAKKLGQQNINIDLSQVSKPVEKLVNESANSTVPTKNLGGKSVQKHGKRYIDLHHKGGGIPQNQILVSQLDTFKASYRKALREQVLLLEVEHGFGKDILRAHVHAFLQIEKENGSIADFRLSATNAGVTIISFALR
jgi:hypothetical protein